VPVPVGGEQPLRDRPGPVTQRLLAAYWDWHRDPAYSQPIDYGSR